MNAKTMEVPMLITNYTSYPFTTCPSCLVQPSRNRVIAKACYVKDMPYSNLMVMTCLKCGETFKVCD